METEVYLNNNNLEVKKKHSVSTIPFISSLAEGVKFGNGKFRSTENLSAVSPIPIRRNIDLIKEEKLRTRRKSWHVGKFEKKRRKGIPVLTSVKLSDGNYSENYVNNNYDHGKRSSWWNIFAPDHWPRSRRSSTDITSSDEKIPYFRGKSRSVDHGLSTPFDLQSLRSKVEGRFESVEKLSKDLITDGKSPMGSKEGLEERKMKKTPPANTVSYKVEPNDTLTSVAARFDTTPSELAILNRLPSRTVFPGQVIRVPDKKLSDADSSEAISESAELVSGDDVSETESFKRLSRSGSKEAEGASEDDILDTLRPSSPKLGSVERMHSPVAHATHKYGRTIERFLKINVRHITDGQGVVSGVLLVTPNAVMFDPNVSDQLVIEHGAESYGVIAPMEFVVNAAIYHDIAHMRVAHARHTLPDPSTSKPEIYHTQGMKKDVELTRLTEDVREKQDSIDEKDINDDRLSQSVSIDSVTQDIQESSKDETCQELRSLTDDDNSICSFEDGRRRIGDAFPKAFDYEIQSQDEDDKKSTPCLKRSEEFSEDERDLRVSSPIEIEAETIEPEKMIKQLEERRKSSLDHHWAIPNKKKSIDNDVPPTKEEEQIENTGDNLVKHSCHDSGIDMREPSLSRKTVYSDADVLLGDGNEFVPPLPVKTRSEEERQKKTSVSFSFNESKDETSSGTPSKSSEESDKHADSKKNKMLKRLSYPLAWMEGIAGEKDDKESIPSSAESSHPSHSSSSVFSKVFSSSPINMVTDFSSGLFLTKTPTEESSKFQFPPSGVSCSLSSHNVGELSSHRCATPSSSTSEPAAKREGFSTFSPSSLISSVGRSSVSSFMLRQPHGVRSDSTKSAPGPRLDYRSMVSVEDMPELFVSFDKLIPRPARSCEEPPLYLRLRMGKPKNKKISKTTPIMSYGKKKMRPEYWFSVPRSRVDDLYKFLNSWVPHLYGDLDDMLIEERGYELVNSDTELWDDEEGAQNDEKEKERRSSDDLGELTRESWEVIKAPYAKIYNMLKNQADQFGSCDTQQSDEVLSMSEELRRALYASNNNSLDLEYFLPDLNGVSEIFTEEHRKQLSRNLPPRAEGYTWTLVFSTSLHGFSLNSMYRKMIRVDSPILMVIQDTDLNVFGALTSCALRVSEHFYGNGESLLYTFTPEFQVHNWTGDNQYFIKGNNESLSIGAGDGKFGIWLDGDLYQGRTEACDTYGNEPLVPGQDFVVKTLECWAFL